MTKIVVLVGAPCVLAASLFLSAPSDTLADEKYREIAEVEHIMSAVVKPISGEIRGALKEGPADDKAWHVLEAQAAVLGEAGQLLLLGKRPRDEVWTGAATALMTGGRDVLAAAKKKDLEAARAASAGIGQACGTCHKKHKK